MLVYQCLQVVFLFFQSLQIFQSISPSPPSSPILTFNFQFSIFNFQLPRFAPSVRNDLISFFVMLPRTVDRGHSLIPRLKPGATNISPRCGLASVFQIVFPSNHQIISFSHYPIFSLSHLLTFNFQFSTFTFHLSTFPESTLAPSSCRNCILPQIFFQDLALHRAEKTDG